MRGIRRGTGEGKGKGGRGIEGETEDYSRVRKDAGIWGVRYKDGEQ